jgi:hypothetical protein
MNGSPVNNHPGQTAGRLVGWYDSLSLLSHSLHYVPTGAKSDPLLSYEPTGKRSDG